MAEEHNDGVNREGLDFRAGWVEALRSFLGRVQVTALRAKKSELPGMEISRQIALELRESMLAKMRG